MSSLKNNDVPNVPICNMCKNHFNGLKCKAFEIIPDEIIFGDNDHTKPLPNQKNDIIFEPIKDEPKK